MSDIRFLDLAEDLELAGLVWQPEIGDEIAEREKKQQVSILVDPQGLTPDELRFTYIWLPTVEQIVCQFEARQAILCHTGLELTERDFHYKTVIQSNGGQLETCAPSLRLSLGFALRSLLLQSQEESIH